MNESFKGIIMSEKKKQVILFLTELMKSYFMFTRPSSHMTDGQKDKFLSAGLAPVALFVILLAALMPASSARGEDGYDLWLRYVKVQDPVLLAQYRQKVTQVIVPGDSPTDRVTCEEIDRGLRSLLGEVVPKSDSITKDGAVLVGTPLDSAIIAKLGWNGELDKLGDEGYIIRSVNLNDKSVIVIASNGGMGALYGTFHFLRMIQMQESLENLHVVEKPRIQLRLLNHWDDLDGTIERGYAGKSLWNWNELPGKIDPRYKDYARACASLGINGAVLNNVNADPRILRTDYLKKIAALAGVFRPYGIKVYLSANFACPLKPSNTPNAMKKWGGIGNLDTADPLDPKVAQWWKDKADEIYRIIPDFGGFVVKADSEGMPGPQKYNRTHAEGANMLADALAPHGGVVMWRAFVYRDAVDKDRAKRAYKEFVPLDGKFRENVFVQTKNGTLDFQPHEPFHPLFGAMPKTPLMAELQITQEYLGHSTHLVYLAPMWKEFLDSDTFARGKGSTVAQVLDGSVHGYGRTGIAGVANTGSDRDWCGHPFAQANWYAFGRLAWNPSLTPEEIADEWIRMTWSNKPEIIMVLQSMMMGSWQACVNYMTPLGLNFTVEARDHYGPDPGRRAGSYWKIDSTGIGYDRTRNGSDAVSQYFPPVADVWNSVAACPEDSLLWFHFVPWDYKMRSGRNLWEELCFRYDSGYTFAKNLSAQWRTLEGQVDDERFSFVLSKLKEQEKHVKHWHDTCLKFFADESGRSVPAFEN
jgi:alpha-glucuronidase